MNITSTAQVCILAGDANSFEEFQEFVDLHPMQGQTEGSDFNFIQALIRSPWKRSLTKSKMNMVTLHTAEKFVGLAKVRAKFSLLKKDNQSVILKEQVAYVIWTS
jgi:hypothetical protein